MPIVRIEKSGVVPAPPETVYAIAADVAAYPEYMSGLEWVRTYDHSVEMAVRVGPVSLVWQQAVDFNPPHSIAFQQTRGPFRYFRGGWTFTPNGEGTCVSYYTEFDLHLPVPGLGLMLRRVVDRNVQEVMRAFRRRLAIVLQRDESTLLTDRCPFVKKVEQVTH